MSHAPQGKLGRAGKEGRPYRFNTSLDTEEMALFERAVRRVGREEFTGGQKVRVAILEWARHVLEEDSIDQLNSQP